MDFINGEIKVLYIKQEGEYLPIACLTENSFSETAEMLGTTTRDNTDGWKSSIPVGQSYTINFSGLLTNDIYNDTKATFHEIRDLKRQRTLVDWKIDSGNGSPDYGQAYISSLGESAAIDEFVSFDGVLTGYGKPENIFDSIYYAYKERVEAASGTLSSEKCTKEYVETLILNTTK